MVYQPVTTSVTHLPWTYRSIEKNSYGAEERNAEKRVNTKTAGICEQTTDLPATTMAMMPAIMSLSKAILVVTEEAALQLFHSCSYIVQINSTLLWITQVRSHVQTQ